ncbi:hypothetical protein [Prescottella equi]
MTDKPYMRCEMVTLEDGSVVRVRRGVTQNMNLFREWDEVVEAPDPSGPEWGA